MPRFSLQLRALDWMLRRPIAHRGLHDLKTGVVENTRSAFEAAIRGNFAIECDVQLSRDGEAMVFHDETLDRLMTTGGPVISRTVDELKAISFRGGSDTIQTLPELLAQVQGRVPLVIEIKSHWDSGQRLSLRVLDVIASYGHPVALMSFDPDVLCTLAVHAPNQTRGIVADRVHDPYYEPLSVARRLALRSFSHLGETRPHFVSFDHAGLPFAPVQMIRGQGFPVITWTIKSDAEASRARRYSDQITFEGYIPA
jgi:glycerophosphoryl diester phosphodiesterase